jgi:TonB-linked SusC/RagA family outer membrane protein
MNISTSIKVIVLFILNMVFSAGMLFAQERAIIGKDSTEAEGTDPKALREEVVTGYSKQLKRNITGAVSVVERSAFTAIPSGNVSNQLQGLASGVTVVGNGQPGNTSKVRIRGIGSFAGNDPLYVIDGVPTQDISSLNPNDVESIAVLKDAGAASIYGARAFNGVIVVTTRNGSKGIQVTYNMSVGTQLPGKGPAKDLLNTQEYADLQWLVYANDGYSEAHPIYGPSSNPAPTLPAWAANTDWYDAITNPALLQNHDITFEGNNEKSRYFVGFGYFDQKGIVIHTFAKRYSGRFNSEWTFMNDHVKVGENFTLAFRQSNGVQNLNESNPIQMGPYRSQSIIPVYITEPIEGSMHEFLPGEYGGAGIIQRLGNATNVVADLTRNKDNFVNNLRLMGSAFIDIKLLKGLNFRSTLGGTYSTAYQLTYTYATYERSENINSASLQEQVRYDGDWVWTNALSLNRTFGEHSIGAVGGYETVKYGIGRNMSAIRAGYFSDALSFRTLTNGSTIVNTTSNFNAPTTLASEFFRADYRFMDKYLISATLRRDGASGQNMEKRHVLFPSVAAGWRISSEPFLNDIQW